MNDGLYIAEEEDLGVFEYEMLGVLINYEKDRGNIDDGRGYGDCEDEMWVTALSNHLSAIV